MMDTLVDRPRGAVTASTRPAVSILVPTFQRPRYLERCLRHHVRAFDEAQIDYELVVLDNASGPEVGEIARRWQEASPRVRWIRHARNIGAPANFLYAHRHARGRIAVLVGDDDLLIPETIARYVELFDADPNLVMIQSPWFVMNEFAHNKILGKAFELGQPEIRFRKGEHEACLDLVLRLHAFPEIYAFRTDVQAEIFGPADTVSYRFFVNLAQALDVGDVLFVDTPHAIVSGISLHGDHYGNAECASGWDSYRGGLDFLASRAVASGAAGVSPELRARIESFVVTRMCMAVRMLTQAKRWMQAWMLTRRLQANGACPLSASAYEELLSLAALDASLIEARALGADVIVVDERLYSILRNVIPDAEQDTDVPLICADEWTGPAEGRIAFIAFGAAAPDDLGSDVVLVDAAAAMRRVGR